jgi:hypothetical protein
MIVEPGNASRLNDIRATPSLWLTNRVSMRALKQEVFVVMMPPSSQRRRRHIGRVHIQTFRSIPRVYPPTPPSYAAVMESLDINQHSTGFR